jgi:SOS-response transcriptional repressor LexA
MGNNLAPKMPFIDANNRAREERLAGVILFISDHIEKCGYSPSVSEVAAHAGVASKDTAHRDLEVLRYRGWITFVPKVARTMRVTDLGYAVLNLTH